MVLDTRAHADLFSDLYNLQAGRTAVALVGAEAEVFHIDAVSHDAPADEQPEASNDTTILFYGQFIPLHGIETIVRAAQSARDQPYRWVLIGQGQEEARIRALLEQGPQADLDWIPWVPYADLNRWLHRSDLCLGIFGDTGKAARVIPNKVFQILAAGRPLVTRDSPAIRELLSDCMPGVYLVPPADPEALLDAIEKFRKDRPVIAAAGEDLHSAVRARFALPTAGHVWSSLLEETLDRSSELYNSGTQSI